MRSGRPPRRIFKIYIRRRTGCSKDVNQKIYVDLDREKMSHGNLNGVTTML